MESTKQTNTESQIQDFIVELEKGHRELLEKERKLNELHKICKEFQKYEDLKQISSALCAHLESILVVLIEQKSFFGCKIEECRKNLEEVRERRRSILITPDTSLENTLNSISMPIEEVSIQTDVQPVEQPPIPQTQVAVTIETQTGNSLKSTSEKPTKKDFTVTYNEPVDAQIQAQLSKESIEEGDTRQRETITISKFTTSGGEETIQISTKPMTSQEPQPLIQEPDDDLMVEASYRKQGETDAKSLELNISNAKPNQPYETVMVEPDETTTEVIVDADGTKRIIVKKLHRTVVRHQQTVQQQNLTSVSTLTQDNVPDNQSFSQVTLKGQQSSTTVARGDGKREMLTNRQYGGKIITGTAGGDIDVQEFNTDPETHYTVIETDKPQEVEIQGVKLHEGDVAFVDETNKLLSSDQSGIAFETSQIHTSTSSVRAVVQQVTRKVIRKTRRIIRRIVVVDGKEQITEEVVEEPEEVEVTEEGVPRVSINVTKTVDGSVVSETQYGQPVTQTEGANIEFEQFVAEEPIVTTTENSELVKQQSEKTLTRQKALSIEPTETNELDLKIDLISQGTVQTSVASPTEIKEFTEQPTATQHLTFVEKSPPILQSTEDKNTIQSPTKSISVSENLEEDMKTTHEMEPTHSEKEKKESEVSEQRYVENKSPLLLPAQHVTTQTSFENHTEIIESRTPASEKVDLEPHAPPVQQISQSPSHDIEIEKVQRVTEDFHALETAQDHPTRDDLPANTQEPIAKHSPSESPQPILDKDKLNTSTDIFLAAERNHEGISANYERVSQSSIASVVQEVETVPLSHVTQSGEKTFQEITEQPELKLSEKLIRSETEIAQEQQSGDTHVPPSPKKQQQGMKITVSLEEKPMDWKFESAKLSSKITIEKGDVSQDEKLQRESNFYLPSITQKLTQSLPLSRHEDVPSVMEPSEHETSITSSEIDHGGRKSKRKKKQKTSAEKPKSEFSEEVEKPTIEDIRLNEEISLSTTLSESTEIIIPSDSEDQQESPQPTIAFESITESDREEESNNTGYEADKTTVDESLIEDITHEKKKRRKRKKQKVKVKDTDESLIPHSISESIAGSHSVIFSDDDKVVKMELDEAKESKKKKRKRNKKEDLKESGSEPISEAFVEETVDDSEELFEPVQQQAEADELDSVNDSYQTISTVSEVDTVKVIEEGVTSPTNEETKEITSEIVSTIPVLEVMITQEEHSQTSPELMSEIRTIETKPTSVQTSPELQVDTTELSIQTDGEPKEFKPEVLESSSQVELSVAEVNVQTTPREASPEEKNDIRTTSMQTSTPEKLESQEEYTQTEESNRKSVEIAETSMQTILNAEERESQTSPIEVSETKTAEVESQATKKLRTPEVHSAQTSPLPSAPPMEDICIGTDKESPIPSLKYATQEMLEREVQTSLTQQRMESIDVETQAQQSLDVHSVQTTPRPSVTLSQDIAVETDRKTSPGTTVEKEIEEREMQTSPIEVAKKETVEVETQAYQSPDIHSVQTSPLPSTQTEDVSVETDRDPDRSHLIRMSAIETTETASQIKPIPEHQSSQTSPLSWPSKQEITNLERKIETHESVTQTTPVPLEMVELTPPSSLSEFEVLIEASITIPTDAKENEQPIFVNVDTEVPQNSIQITKKEHEPENIAVAVSIDNLIHKKHSTLTDFIEKEKADQFSETPIEGMVISSIVTDLNEEKLDEMRNKGFSPQSEDTQVQIKLSVDADSSEEKSDSSDSLKVESIITETTQKAIVDDTSELSEITEVPTTETESSTQDTVKTAINKEVCKPQPASLEPSVQKNKISSPKTKPKNKHITSVTIEEVQSPHVVVDTPVTPSEDFSISPPVYPSTHWSHTEPRYPKKESEDLINSEKQVSVVFENVAITWANTQTLERIKNLQNAQRTTHLSDVLYLATLSEVITEESIEQRSSNVERQLKLLQEAVERKDVQIIQHTIITTVETITTWLETIEYRIYVSRQQTSEGPSAERVEEFNNLKEEIVEIEEKIGQLQTELGKADDIYNEDDRNRMKSYIDSLQQQVKIIEDVTEENGQLAAGDLQRWNEFIEDLTSVTQNILRTQEAVNLLKDSDAAPQTKLNELETLDGANKTNTVKAVQLLSTAKGLLRDFPTREIPKELHRNQQLVKQIEQQILDEREKAFQFLTLADEYEQTLNEFSKIVDIAEAIVESPLTVRNLKHLENEMQNHRKFFVNLSHCRAILESLEENLDSETKAKHSELHNSLYDRARVILDKATGRFQQMFSAASKWTSLKQSMREEMRWLQVAQERVPGIINVTSYDYLSYKEHYTLLSQDIAEHQATLLHLKDLASRVQELVVCSGMEQEYTDALEIVMKLQEDVKSYMQRIIGFTDHWNRYKEQIEALKMWLKIAAEDLDGLEQPEPQSKKMRQFWVSFSNQNIHFILP